MLIKVNNLAHRHIVFFIQIISPVNKVWVELSTQQNTALTKAYTIIYSFQKEHVIENSFCICDNNFLFYLRMQTCNVFSKSTSCCTILL